jgi:hypothetical protein
MHRSGTTWVGRSIAGCFEMPYVHEPANPDVFRAAHVHYEAIEDSARLLPAYGYALGVARRDRLESATRGSIRDWPARIATAVRGRDVVVKDPFAFLNAKLLQNTYDLDVILAVRHPAGVVSSALRLGWAYDFEELVGQRRVAAEMPEHMDLIERLAREERDIVSQISALWMILHSWWRQSPEAPSEYSIARHSELVEDPFRVVGLLPERKPNLVRLSDFVAKTSSSKVVDFEHASETDIVRNRNAMEKVWVRRLDRRQITMVRDVVEEEACMWGFTADSW